MEYFVKTKLLLSAIVVVLAVVYFLYLRSDVMKASLLFVNGIVHTVNDKHPLAEAVAISDDRIAGVGTTEEILRKFRSDHVVDLGGKPVYPGFIDSHAHLEGLGVFLLNLDLHGTSSVAEIQQRVRERVLKARPGVWIRGRGWDQNRWTLREFPGHASLDSVSGEFPVYLNRVDGHAVWVNRKVLELAGITRETPDPPGGRIVRDPDGEPTGVFVDNAVDLIKAALPEPSREERTEAILTAVQSCLSVGLTGVHDMGVELESIGIYKDLISKRQFPLRVYCAIEGSGATWNHYEKEGPEIGGPGKRLTVRALKLYADGALGSYGAALIEPYSDDPSNRGLTLTSADSIRYFAGRALDEGFQLCIHAIGDRANHIVLNIYEEMFNTYGPGSRDVRFRIEHAQVLAPEDIPRFKQLEVIPAMQPTHCTSDMYWAGTRLGSSRTAGCYAWRSLIDSGVKVPAGSDFPVESNNPLWGFYAAVTRRDHNGWPEGGWHPEQRMSREEALKAFTIWGAFAAFEEDLKGSIEIGKLADLVVLSRDIMTIEPPEILQTTVDMTILGGEIVYQAGTVASMETR
jgi:hypothetical protein